MRRTSLFYLFLLTVTVTTVNGKNYAMYNDFSVSNLLYSFTETMSNFGSMMSSINELYNVLVTDDDLNITSNSDVTADYEVKFLNIIEIAAKYGYDIEEHKVTTEDGYILTMHRLPHGKKHASNKLVTFLMHGLLDSSDCWVLQGPNKSLAFVLADHGFDVWMGNARGNKHANHHINISTNNPEFWDYTWEETGLYDLPAMIDYTLNVTKNESLYYVGHSQGTTNFYVMASMKPEYNRKVKMMFSLSPVAWMGHVKSPIVRMFSPSIKILGYLLANFNTYAPSADTISRIMSDLCIIMPARCTNSLYMFMGSLHRFDTSMLPVILGHMPSGSSIHQFVHYGQLIQSEKFRRFDYGVKGNLKEYGETIPPEYDLSNVSVPIVIYYSDIDWLSDSRDVEILKNKLGNVWGYNYVKNFNHLDYLYASEADNIVYSNIINYINEFENGIGTKDKMYMKDIVNYKTKQVFGAH